MKKVLILLIGVSLSLVTATSQSYRPLLKVGKVWNYYYTNGFNEYNLCWKVVGDTIIDDEQCFKISAMLTDQWTGEVVSKSSTPGVYLEKYKKVFERRQNTWNLFYDFNLKAGDVISFGNYNGRTVDNIDIIYVMGQSFRRMNIKEAGYLVEGIGCSEGFLGSDNLVSCYEDGKCIFTGHNFDNMPSHQTNVGKHPLLQDGKSWWYYDGDAEAMFTTPVNFCMYLDGDTLINGTRWEKVYRNTPTPLYEKAIREDEGRVYEMLPNGNEHMLFDFTLQVGDTYTPDGDNEHSLRVIAVDTMLSAGNAYRRLFLQQNVKGVDTDLTTWIEGIGSECGIDQTALWSDQDWKVAEAQHTYTFYALMFLGCDLNGCCIYGLTPTGVTSISKPNYTISVDIPIFDLQGRRLSTEPKHGVYIRNGKKVVK